VKELVTVPSDLVAFLKYSRTFIASNFGVLFVFKRNSAETVVPSLPSRDLASTLLSGKENSELHYRKLCSPTHIEIFCEYCLPTDISMLYIVVYWQLPLLTTFFSKHECQIIHYGVLKLCCESFSVGLSGLNLGRLAEA